MTPDRPAGTLERAIGRVLRAGIAVSSVCLATGLLFSLAGSSSWSNRLLNVGLVILIATPAARVVVSVVGYVIEHDWLFVVLTSIVLLELVGSLVAAMR